MSYEGLVESVLSMDLWPAIQRVDDIDYFLMTPIEFIVPTPSFVGVAASALIVDHSPAIQRVNAIDLERTLIEDTDLMYEYFWRTHSEAINPSMDNQMEIIPPPAPDFKKKRGLISRGRLGNDGISGMRAFSFSHEDAAWRMKTELREYRLKLRREVAMIESETYSTPAVDAKEEHWKPTGLKAAMLPRVRPYLTDAQAYDIVVQDYLAHVQPEHVEEAPFDSSCNWKKRHQIHDPVVADVPSSADCFEPGDETDSESEAMAVPTDEEVLSGESGASVDSGTEIATADSHGPRSEPSRKRSAASAFDEDNLSAQIRSYVDQQIEKAFLPLLSALRSREEDEHKHRQKILALEKEKLALMRQKLECTRRSNAVPASAAN